MPLTFSGITISGGWNIQSTFVPDAPIVAQETLVCATASEGNNLSISAPTGAIFTSIQFASYGTPSGTCGLYVTGGCNSSNSLSVVRSALLGQTGTQTIAATNVNFGGDPCSGTAKNLYVAAYTGSAIATGATTANIVFTAPTNGGSSTITSYTATSSPGGITGTLNQAGSGTINVTGLSASTSYTFTVTATNSNGTSVTSQPTNSITTSASSIPAEMLVVAGGGGGGNGNNGRGRGGGGAGGLLYSASRNIAYATNYTVTIGGGGAAGTVSGLNATYGSPGENSSFSGSDFTATALGGGAGSAGGVNLGTGGTGGSGGGGGGFYGGTSTSGGSATQTDSGGLTGYGNNGGGGSGSASVYGAGGGGGAGTAGATGTSTKSGNGGDGRQYDISGTNTYYAGGGGSIGSASGTAASGSAGLGGGGAANTGGGGGGANNADNRVGGSGIVIIRYSDTYPAATSTTGSPTITVAGGYRVYKYTSSGSITF